MAGKHSHHQMWSLYDTLSTIASPLDQKRTSLHNQLNIIKQLHFHMHLNIFFMQEGESEVADGKIKLNVVLCEYKY